MDIKAAQTAIRRAEKRFAHSVRAMAAAETESARKRHARRMISAQRGQKAAEAAFAQAAGALDWATD